jgi:predicted FMN-binding regulatory protein PaiB
MKAALVASVWAMRALTDLRVPLRDDLLLACVQGEQDGGLGTSATLARWRADACVIPEPTSLALPTHFCVEPTPGASILLVHLAQPNPVWAALQARPAVLLSVVDDYAYIPSTWRAKAGGPDVRTPTSYYTAVQFTCHAEIVDEPHAKAELLRQQLAHFQPAGDHAQVAVDQPPYGRMLAGGRACACTCGPSERSSNTTTTTPNSTAPPSPAGSTPEPQAATQPRPVSNDDDCSKSVSGRTPGKPPASNSRPSRGSAYGALGGAAVRMVRRAVMSSLTSPYGSTCCQNSGVSPGGLQR